jgi:hypothetical protein
VFQGASLRNCDFSDADLKSADFENSEMWRVNFCFSDLENAVLPLPLGWDATEAYPFATDYSELLVNFFAAKTPPLPVTPVTGRIDRLAPRRIPGVKTLLSHFFAKMGWHNLVDHLHTGRHSYSSAPVGT